MTKVYAKGCDTALTDHFKAYEFDCPCANCTETLIDDELVLRLDALRASLGFPLKILSGYRCAKHQAQLKAEGYETAPNKSQHEEGKAADCKTGHHTGLELEAAARKAGFKAVGVGAHFIHADTRSDKTRRWTYSY